MAPSRVTGRDTPLDVSTGAVPIGTVTGVEDAGAPWRWWRSVPTLLADGLLAALVLAISLVEVAVNDGLGDDDEAGGRSCSSPCRR